MSPLRELYPTILPKIRELLETTWTTQYVGAPSALTLASRTQVHPDSPHAALFSLTGAINRAVAEGLKEVYQARLSVGILFQAEIRAGLWRDLGPLLEPGSKDLNLGIWEARGDLSDEEKKARILAAIKKLETP